MNNPASVCCSTVVFVGAHFSSECARRLLLDVVGNVIVVYETRIIFHFAHFLYEVNKYTKGRKDGTV